MKLLPAEYLLLHPTCRSIKWQLNLPYDYYSGCPLGKEGVFIAIGSGTQITAYKPTINRKPVADFRISKRDINASQSVDFFDQSSYTPTSWNWTFTGGTPSSSTSQNPSGIVYNTQGIYEVKLIAINSYGSDTLTKTSYVFVSQGVGITGNNTIVKDYKLEQNYPNPFNPTTNIRYELPKSGFVKIIVFDALGKEIKTIVNEKQSAGTYNLTFDGSNLPSGVYFYRLRAGDYVETKKLVLLK